MAFKLTIHDGALAELEDATDWYAKISNELSGDFADKFILALDNIRNGSSLNAEIRAGYRKQNMERFPYKLVYRILSPNEILVVAVAHNKRRPGYWRKRK